MIRFKTCLAAVGLLIALGGSSQAQRFVGGGFAPGAVGQSWGAPGVVWGYSSPYYGGYSPYGGYNPYGYYGAVSPYYGYYSPPLTTNQMGGLMQAIQGATGRRRGWR